MSGDLCVVDEEKGEWLDECGASFACAVGALNVFIDSDPYFVWRVEERC